MVTKKHSFVSNVKIYKYIYRADIIAVQCHMAVLSECEEKKKSMKCWLKEHIANIFRASLCVNRSFGNKITIRIRSINNWKNVYCLFLLYKNLDKFGMSFYHKYTTYTTTLNVHVNINMKWWQWELHEYLLVCVCVCTCAVYEFGFVHILVYMRVILLISKCSAIWV